MGGRNDHVRIISQKSPSGRFAPSLDQPHDFRRGGRDMRAGPINGGDALRLQSGIVLRRDDAAAHDQNIARAQLFQGFQQGRH